MLVKIHQSYRSIVAVCDSNLIGRKLIEGERALDLTGQFFRGEEKTKEEVEEILEDMRKEDASFNIVGKESCNVAVEVGLIDEEGIFYVSGVPFSLVLL